MTHGIPVFVSEAVRGSKTRYAVFLRCTFLQE